MFGVALVGRHEVRAGVERDVVEYARFRAGGAVGICHIVARHIIITFAQHSVVCVSVINSSLAGHNPEEDGADQRST